MLTGFVVKVNVGGFTAPVGLVATAALSVTLPVKPFAGVMVMVDVLPVVAPAVIVTAVPATVKVGGAVVTVTALDPVAVL
jgi:hypothetical protein